MDTESNKRKLRDLSSSVCEESVAGNMGELSSSEDTVFAKLDALENDISGRYGVVRRLEELEGQLADLTNDFCEVKAENQRLKSDHVLMKAILAKKDSEIQELKRAVVDQKSRSMRNNILLHNIPEEKGEDCEAKLKEFITKQTTLQTPQVNSMIFERVHRVGPYLGGEQKRPRMIVAKLSSYKDKETIIEAWRQCRSGSKLDKSKGSPKVTTHLPQELLEQRSLNFQLVDNIKAVAGPDKVSVKLAYDKAYVNNQPIHPKVTKPSVGDILKITEEETKEALQLQRRVSTTRTERGSSFVAEAIRTSSLNAVRTAYKQVLSDPRRAGAAHNILVYRVGNDLGWLDDGDLGSGRFLASWLKRLDLQNIAVIVTRQHGGEHLSSRRFELLRQVADEAQKLLNLKQ